MARSKVVVSIDSGTLKRLDRLVRLKAFPSRSRAVQEAMVEKLERLERIRLARECAELDPQAEEAVAEEGMSAELASWPAY